MAPNEFDVDATSDRQWPSIRQDDMIPSIMLGIVVLGDLICGTEMFIRCRFVACSYDACRSLFVQ